MIRRRDLAALVAPVLTGCKRGTQPTVRIAVPTGVTEAYPVYVADSLGYFRDEGLTAVIQEFPGSRMMESLLGGTSDAVYYSYSTILGLAGDAHLVRSIFVGLEVYAAILAVSGKKADVIRSVRDLRGATVGVNTFGSPQHLALGVHLSRAGLRFQDVSVVAYGSGATAIASLQHGKVDAGIINGSAYNVLKRRTPEVRALVDARTREATEQLIGSKHWPAFCLVGKVAWIEQNTAIAQKAVNAMTRALRWTQAHRAEEVRDHLPASLRTDDAECDLETLRLLIAGASKDGRMMPEAPGVALRYMAAGNGELQSASIDLDKTYTNRFVEEATR